ncbi:MAG: preprotein translocase subunit YajC [Pseudomonadota bacterium]
MTARLSTLGAYALIFAAAAYGQESTLPDSGPSGTSMLLQNLFFIGAMIAIFYFLLIRPQQRRQKQHQEMLGAVARGDTIITSGGLIGKVTKVGETELTVELADSVRVRVVKSMIADVRNKSEPVAANDSKPS